jgi:hypothetical protein
MSLQIDRIQATRAARAIRVGPAAAIGLALLVLGLAIGLLIGRLQTGSAERATSASVASAAPSATAAPVPGRRDGYATRHLYLGQLPEAPVLTSRDDYATRHLHLGQLP